MPPWLVDLLTPIGLSIAVYTGIRIDLAIAKEKANQALQNSKHAHQRIDRMMERGKA